MKTFKQYQLGDVIKVTQGRACTTYPIYDFEEEFDPSDHKRKDDLLEGWIIGIRPFLGMASALIVDEHHNYNIVRLY